MHALGLEFGSAAQMSKRPGSVWNCLWGNALKRSPGIIRKSRVSYPVPGFISSATWPSLPKKHYNGLNQTKPNLVSRKSRLSSSNGSPRYFVTTTIDRTSLANAFCALSVVSWWRIAPLLGCMFASNSMINLDTSVPATIQQPRALGLSIRPTAPPHLP